MVTYRGFTAFLSYNHDQSGAASPDFRSVVPEYAITPSGSTISCCVASFPEAPFRVHWRDEGSGYCSAGFIIIDGRLFPGRYITGLEEVHRGESTNQDGSEDLFRFAKPSANGEPGVIELKITYVKYKGEHPLAALGGVGSSKYEYEFEPLYQPNRSHVKFKFFYRPFDTMTVLFKSVQPEISVSHIALMKEYSALGNKIQGRGYYSKEEDGPSFGVLNQNTNPASSSSMEISAPPMEELTRPLAAPPLPTDTLPLSIEYLPLTVEKQSPRTQKRTTSRPSPRTSKASARRLSSSPVTPTRRRKSIKHPSNKDLYEQKKQTRYAELVYRQEEKKAAKGASAQYIEDKIKEIKASGRWGKSWDVKLEMLAAEAGVVIPGVRQIPNPRSSCPTLQSTSSGGSASSPGSSSDVSSLATPSLQAQQPGYTSDYSGLDDPSPAPGDASSKSRNSQQDTLPQFGVPYDSYSPAISSTDHSSNSPVPSLAGYSSNSPSISSMGHSFQSSAPSSTGYGSHPPDPSSIGYTPYSHTSFSTSNDSYSPDTSWTG